MKKYLSIALALAALTAAGAAPGSRNPSTRAVNRSRCFPASRGQNTDYLPASPWGGPARQPRSSARLRRSLRTLGHLETGDAR